jgi:hypothetical protein
MAEKKAELVCPTCQIGTLVRHCQSPHCPNWLSCPICDHAHAYVKQVKGFGYRWTLARSVRMWRGVES